MTPDNVRKIMLDIMNDFDLTDLEPQTAQYMTAYISGMLEMANAVIDALEEVQSNG